MITATSSPMAPSKPLFAPFARSRDMPPQRPQHPANNPPSITVLQSLPRLLHPLERHAGMHSSRTPSLSPLPLHSPRDPLCCT